jgi:hypothetical protein
MDIIIGELSIDNCDVDIILERYTRRDYKPHREGDDIKDVGRKSYEIIVRGNIELNKFKLLNAEANRKTNKIKFLLGEFDILCKRLEYKSNGDFTMQLIEDVMPESEDIKDDESQLNKKSNVYISDPLIDYDGV